MAKVCFLGDRAVNAQSTPASHLFEVASLGAHTVGRVGQAGDTVADVDALYLSEVDGYGYDALVYMAGHNSLLLGELPAFIWAAMRNTLARAVLDGLSPVIVATLTPLGAYSAWTEATQTALEALNALIRADLPGGSTLCELYDSPLRSGVDLAGIYDSGDGLLPNLAGQQVQADRIAAVWS